MIKNRKKVIEDALETGVRHQAEARGTTSAPKEVDPLSPEGIEAEYQKQKAAKKKKGWLW